jgi:hypothetical protein
MVLGEKNLQGFTYIIHGQSHGGGSRDLLVEENMYRLITTTKSD